jgi:ABC-2 type transport system permease protein
MRAYLLLEIRRSLRDRQYLALVVGWPVGAYLLFAAVFGAQPGGGALPVDTALMVAMATFGALGAALTATGPRLAIDRQGGWLRQLRLTPLPSTRVVAARVVAALALTMPAIVLTFGVAALVHGVRLAAWEWLGLGIVLCLGCLPFAALGIVIGLVADGDNVQGLTMVVYLALSALGGLWVPVSILPAALQTLARALPSDQVAELGWRIAAGQAPTLGSAAVLLAWLVGAALAAVVLSRRLAVRG